MRKQNIVNRPFALDAAEDYRTKATLGITGWYCLSVHSDGSVRHLDVGSRYPGGGEAPKGLAVRQLKSYASWVQTVQKRFLHHFKMHRNFLLKISSPLGRLRVLEGIFR